MWTPQSDGKGERLCFIERKDKSFVSNCRDFRREMFLFFDLANGKTKTRGLFFELFLVFLIAAPLSPAALLLRGKIGSCFLAPLGVRSVSGPPVGCPLAHDALARGDAHPRLAHSASFPFFAFTPHLQSIELLNVRGEGLCNSSIFTGG